jgi:serine/threonine protein kinase
MNQDPMIGRQLANFRIERVLGHGGMATVYYGQDIKLQRPVAIKVIDPGHREKTSYIERFIQEARALAGWRHENIIQIYYADDENGLYYFVMEYIDGQNLQEILAEYTSNGELMDFEDVLQIGMAIGSALDYAHQNGVIHRDVKPSNIFIERSGRVMLGDFGLALDIQQGSIGETFGTAHYIAPEQAKRSSDAVAESDLYSMGVVLYEMLTGIVPFDDPSPTSVALQHITQPPPPPRQVNPNLNEQVEAVLLKILSKSPAERYHSGSELIAALKKALKATPISTTSQIELPPPPPGLPSRQTPHPLTYSQVSVAQRVQKYLNAAPAQVPIEPTQRVNYPSAGQASPPAIEKVEPTWKAPAPEVHPVEPSSAAPSSPEPLAGRTHAKPAPSRRIILVGSLLTGCLLVVIIAVFALTTVFVKQMVGSEQVNHETQDNQRTSPPLAISTDSNISEPTAVPTIASLPTETFAPGSMPVPTVKYPNGQRFVLYYDDNSFYILQVTGDKTYVSSISFERLDKMDVPSNRFSGQRWAEFYATIKPGICMRIEILNSSPYLRPPQCTNQYYATRTPTRDDPGIFWTPVEGSVKFRVNWKNEEVALCEISAGVCEIYLP